MTIRPPISSLLFARPSFLEGVARIFDFGDTLSEYNEAIDGPQADRLALMADAAAVRRDIEKSRRQMTGFTNPL